MAFRFVIVPFFSKEHCISGIILFSNPGVEQEIRGANAGKIFTMTSTLVVVVCFAFYFAGYMFYSRFLAQQVFAMRPDAVTPAHALQDGIDYVPTRPLVLFGHHYASITGFSPMLGPAIAVVWGWLPAMLWVVFGAILIGCVHDFGALVISVRAKGLLDRCHRRRIDRTPGQSH